MKKTWLSASVSAAGRLTFIARTPSDEKPGSTARTRARLRRRSPERHHDEKREGDLRDEERRALPSAAGRRRRSEDAVLQGRLRVRAERRERRGEPEENSGRDRGREGKQEHGAVDAGLGQPRDVFGRGGEQGRRGPDGQEEPEAPAEEREQDAFRQELTHHAGAARADGRADGKLALPGGGAREQQVRDVRAGEEQHEGDRGKEGPERRPGFGDAALEKRDDHRPLAAVGPRVLRLEPRHDRVELGPRRRERGARRQAREDAQALVIAALEPTGLGAVPAERPVEIDRLREESERLGQDAHDDVRDAVEPDRSPHDRGIGPEAASPERGGEQGDGSGPGPIVGFGERAAERRLDAQNREERRRHLAAAQDRRLSGPGEGDAIRPVGRLRRERAAARAPVEEVHPGNALLPEPETPLGDDDEPVRLGVGQGTQQHRVDDREDCRVRADAERERGDRNGGEARRTPECPERIAQVLSECVHGVTPTSARPWARRARPGAPGSSRPRVRLRGVRA